MLRKIFQWILCLITAVFFILPSYANSANTYWQGTDGYGVVTGDEDCPIEVKHENLTFSLPVQLISEQGKFIAEYTFENPSDLNVNVLLSFPLGRYSSSYGDMNADDSPYQVMRDGERADTIARYTYLSGAFDLKKDLAKLKEEYISDTFFTPQLPVSVYQYEVHLEEEPQDGTGVVTFEMDVPEDRRKIRILPYYDGGSFEDDHIVIQRWVSDELTFTIAVFGEQMEEDPVFTLSQSYKDDSPLKGSIERIRTDEMTYEEYVLSCREENSPFSDVDWYNAMTQMFLSTSENNRVLSEESVQDHLMCWLQYELNFAPSKTIVNTVSAPVYPSIDASYEENVYEIVYLLSPASTWKKFGTLDIRVETEMVMTESSLEGFEKTETGYELHLDQLPDQELEFSLCAAAQPKKKTNVYSMTIIALLVGGALVLILLAALIIYLIKVLFRFISRK